MNRFLLVALLPLAAGCPSPPGETAPPASAEEPAPDWSRAFETAVRFDAGDQAIVLHLRIAPGFHAYTVGETTGRPLALELAPDAAFALRGPVRYPEGIKKDLPIGPSVIVEGRSKIVAPIVAREGETSDRVQGTLQYQVCTDALCDRPRKRAFEVTVAPSPGP